MTIYLPRLGSGMGQPLTNTSSSGTWESVKEGFSQGFREGPVNSVFRSDEVDNLINDQDSPLIPKDEADKRLTDAGIRNITIPKTGITQSYLDHVLKENVNRLKAQTILSTNGDGVFNSGAVFLAQLAGDMADPGNIAIAFVPYAGQLATASRWSRFSGRFVQGVKIGGAQALVASPLTMHANIAEGQEYSTADVAVNVAFGTIAGGSMNALGGFIGDVVRSRRAGISGISSEQSTTKLQSDDLSPIDNVSGKKGVNSHIEDYAYKTAYEEIITTRQQNAPDNIRGKAIPDELVSAIEVRAKSIINELKDFTGNKNSAMDVIDNSPWPIRQQSIRAAIAQAMEGKRPNVEPFYDLTNPSLRKSALQKIANYDGIRINDEALRASRDALESVNRANKTDIDNAIEDFNYELDTVRNRMVDSDDVEMKRVIDTISKEANDSSYIDGLRAFAGCMIRRV